MFESNTQFGKLSTKGGNTCKQKEKKRDICGQRPMRKTFLGHQLNMQLLQYLVESMINGLILDRLRCLHIEDRIRGDKILT